MTYRIEPHHFTASRASAWDGREHVADLRRGQQLQAKPLRLPLHLMTYDELIAHSDYLRRVAETLRSWA